MSTRPGNAAIPGSATVSRRKFMQQMGYASPVQFYIDKPAEGISTLAAAFAPEPVIVRMSDFKSNEDANRVGGGQYELDEENPVLGFRGAFYHISGDLRDCFDLEMSELKKVRENMGLENVHVMIPFVGTVEEPRQVSYPKLPDPCNRCGKRNRTRLVPGTGP